LTDVPSDGDVLQLFAGDVRACGGAARVDRVRCASADLDGLRQPAHDERRGDVHRLTEANQHAFTRDGFEALKLEAYRVRTRGEKRNGKVAGPISHCL